MTRSCRSLPWASAWAFSRFGCACSQVVDLQPGTHQYKVIVDGQWRHDHTAPTVLDNLGMPVGRLNQTSCRATAAVACHACAVSPRLQKASQVRNHQSSADFLTDRFRSQLVRYACVFLQLLP